MESITYKANSIVKAPACCGGFLFKINYRRFVSLTRIQNFYITNEKFVKKEIYN